MKKNIIAQVVNNRLLPFCEKNDSTMDISAESDFGIRLYRDTLTFMFECAVNNVFKYDHCVILGNSIGDGYYFYFDDDYMITDDDILKLRNEMKRLNSCSKKIEKLEIGFDEAVKILNKRKCFHCLSLVKSLSRPFEKYYHYDDTYSLASNILLSDFSFINHYEIFKYKEGILLRYPRKGETSVQDDWHDNPLLFKTVRSDRLVENKIPVIKSIGMLNELIESGKISEYIEISEMTQRMKICKLAEDIISRNKVKTVFIAGPSASNKTTFAHKLCTELKVYGISPINISLDDYYFTKDKITARDEKGNIDLECIEAIDVELFKENIRDLQNGKEVVLPRYEFNYNGIGRRLFDRNPVKLNDNNIIIVEGIHALNKSLSKGLDSSLFYYIYTSPLIQLNLDEYHRIRTTDLRILRRMVRDFRTRNASAFETLNMWSSVERGERKYIFPYQNNVDYIFSSAHAYEIAVLSVYALPLLRSVKPKQKSEYIAAQRLIKLLSFINPLSATFVPAESMLHEFIG